MRALDGLSLGALYAVLLWAPLASGAYRGWALAVTQLLTLAALLLWILAMLTRRRLEWRRSALDLPLALLIGLVLIQLAVGNGPLVRWALAPPPTDPNLPTTLPARLLAVGTVAPAQTARSLLLFLTYAGVYALVVNLIRSRRALDRLVRTLLVSGSLLAFLGLLDYLAGEAWLIRWRDHPFERRLAGTFVNPDHFAAWLGMLICLGIGYVLARARADPLGAPRSRPVSAREGRERQLRRWLPFIGVGVMALALVFTLSRAGVLSVLVALAGLLALMGALGRTRWSLVVIGALLTVTVSYGAWIGFEPLLERVRHAPYGLRLVQSLTTLPMLSAFPVLGVGLGAYREIYFRYQPAALGPGTYYLPFAHNDLLQLVVELGLIGTPLCVLALWRVGQDLLLSHLLGRGRCPVGAGQGDGARRNEPWSVGVGLGALAGILALFVHSAFDFGARIPANGVLGATCLGIATVALHTRFSPGRDRFLAGVRARVLGPGRLWPSVIAGGMLVVSLYVILMIVRPPWVETRLAGTTGALALARLDEALALAPRDVQALTTRARLRFTAAREIWDSGRTPDGRIMVSWDERQHAALALLDSVIPDLHAALLLTPTNPYLHETLAWVHGTIAVIDPAPPAAHLASALASLHRAIALQPENPFLYRSLATLALAQRQPLTVVALKAGRDAVKREPNLLADLVLRFLPAGLSEAEWLEIVPPTAVDRLDLAQRLARSGLPQEAASVYRQAIEVAPPDLEPFARFRLAQLLIRRHDAKGAVVELDLALVLDPDNPELHLARARALAQLADPAALDAHRTAVIKAEAREADPGGERLPFRVTGPRPHALVLDALGSGERVRAATYRRALAEYLNDRKLWAQALDEWERVLAVFPQDAAGHFGSGIALSGLGERDRAVRAYRNAVSLDGHAVPFRLGLARALWETDQYYQAINEWRAVIAQEPGHIDAHLALAQAYLRIGERVEAFREYQLVLKMVPDQPEARRGLSRLGG